MQYLRESARTSLHARGLQLLELPTSDSCRKNWRNLMKFEKMEIEKSWVRSLHATCIGGLGKHSAPQAVPLGAKQCCFIFLYFMSCFRKNVIFAGKPSLHHYMPGAYYNWSSPRLTRVKRKLENFEKPEIEKSWVRALHTTCTGAGSPLCSKSAARLIPRGSLQRRPPLFQGAGQRAAACT